MINVTRVKLWSKADGTGYTRGFADAVVDGIKMNLRIVESPTRPGEMFVGMPSTQYMLNGKIAYKQTVTLSKEVYAEVTKHVMTAFASASTVAKAKEAVQGTQPSLPGTCETHPVVSLEEINKISMVVTEGLFSDAVAVMAQPVQKYKAGLRAVQIMHYKFIQQNLNKTSGWAALARNGCKVVQISVAGKLVGAMVDGIVSLY